MNDGLNDLRRLEADLLGAGVRGIVAGSAVLLHGGAAIRDTAIEFAKIGPTHQWHDSMVVYADGTERAPVIGDTAIEVTNTDWAAHIIEFGTADHPALAAIGPAFDRHTPDILEQLGTAASVSVLGGFW